MAATRDLWFELTSPSAFAGYLDYRGESVRSLAAKCVVKGPNPGQRKTLSPATIGHLRSGAQRTCTPETASAIEAALEVPPGILFVPRVRRRDSAATAA